MSARCFSPYPDDFSPQSSRAYGLRRAGLAARYVADSSPERAEQIANLIATESSFKGAVAAEWLKGFKRSGIASIQERLTGTLDDTARALDQRVRIRVTVPKCDVQDVIRFLETMPGAGKDQEAQRCMAELRAHGSIGMGETWMRDVEGTAPQEILESVDRDCLLADLHRILAPMHTDGVYRSKIPCFFPLYGVDGPAPNDWDFEIRRVPHLLAEPRTYGDDPDAYAPA